MIVHQAQSHKFCLQQVSQMQTSLLSPIVFSHLNYCKQPPNWSLFSLCPSITSLSSDQISRSVVSDSLRPHESQHARPPCPSLAPGVHSDSCPSSQWCHPAISSCVVPFSSCPQSLPESDSFPMSQLFAWGGQSTGVSALASFLPKLQIHTTFLILQAFIECKTPDPMPTDGDKKQTKYTGKL